MAAITPVVLRGTDEEGKFVSVDGQKFRKANNAGKYIMRKYGLSYQDTVALFNLTDFSQSYLRQPPDGP